MFADQAHLKKQEFYHNKIVDSTNVSREIWNIVNTNLGIQTQISISTLLVNDMIIQDQNTICNLFCNYFSEIAEKSLLDNYENLNGDCTTGRKCSLSLFFYDITPEKILEHLNDMQNKKSSGHDGIPIKVLKYVSQFIIYPLCYL